MSSLKIELLNQVADSLCKNPRGLMGGKWNKREAEEVATKTIISCRNNFSENGHAFIWTKHTQNNGCPVTINYATGLKILISDKSIVMEDYHGSLIPPANTIYKNGIPQILRVTNKLLEYAEKLIG